MARRKKRNVIRNKIELDIVIPVYGQPELLNKCLQSIRETCEGINYQIIIVDDKSPEDMSDVYSNLGRDIKISVNEKNLGFPLIANKGASLGTAKDILFLNSDVELLPNCVQTMIASMYDDNIPVSRTDPVLEENDKYPIGIVGAKLLFPSDSVDQLRPAKKIQHAGVIINMNAEPKHVGIGWSENHPRANVRRTMQAVTGACLLTRRETWNIAKRNLSQNGDTMSNGGFCAFYGRGTFEDIEYCVSTRLNKFRVLYEPNAVAIHHTGQSIKATKEGYPIEMNLNLFKNRCGQAILWDEWIHY